MEILNLSEDNETLTINEISLKDITNYNHHILHSGKLNHQILKYIVMNTKVSFEEIKKLFLFDFRKAEKNINIILINKTAFIR